VALLESRTGQQQAPAYVLATALELDGPGSLPAARTAAVRWSLEGNAWVGRAELEGLPPGRYALAPRGAHLQRFEPTRAEVQSGDAPARFVLLDAPGDFDLHLFVLDDATSAPLERYEVEFVMTHGTRVVKSRRAVALAPGEARPTVLTALPGGAQVSWRVRAEGYAPAEGVLDPRRALSHRDERLVHRVEQRLERERP
jgi:hypothetical protein